MSSDNVVLGTATTGGAAAAAIASTADNNNLAMLIGLSVGLLILASLGYWVRRRSMRE